MDLSEKKAKMIEMRHVEGESRNQELPRDKNTFFSVENENDTMRKGIEKE